MAFGETDPARVVHQWTVEKVGGDQAKGTVEQELTSRRDQQICATHHFRNLHRRIIGYARELVSGNIIVAPDNKVTEIAPGDELLWAKIHVAE